MYDRKWNWFIKAQNYYSVTDRSIAEFLLPEEKDLNFVFQKRWKSQHKPGVRTFEPNAGTWNRDDPGYKVDV